MTQTMPTTNAATAGPTSLRSATTTSGPSSIRTTPLEEYSARAAGVTGEAVMLGRTLPPPVGWPVGHAGSGPIR
jgi:hypothetical protein